LKRLIERLATVALTCIASSPAFADARTDYVLNCMGCHRADGLGTPPDVPALAERVGYYLQVEGGREYLVQVPGAANAPLSDGALAGVINWIVRSFAGASVPAVFEPFSADEVTRARGTRPVDVTRQRADLAGRIRARFPEALW
jgi:hypothetical protein